jgi:hypothetical protein
MSELLKASAFLQQSANGCREDTALWQACGGCQTQGKAQGLLLLFKLEQSIEGIFQHFC